MSASVHGHEVMHMMLQASTPFTKASLIADIEQKFGAETRFHTCSAENMTAAELVEFLERKGKFIPAGDGFCSSEDKICRH